MSGTTAAAPSTTPEVPPSKLIFVTWVRDFGVAKLAREMQITTHAVYAWLRPVNPILPHPVKAQQLVRLSGGAVRLEDIYAEQN